LFALRNHTHVAALGALVVVVLSGIGLSRSFSVSCPRDADCVTLRELEAGEPLPEALRLYDREGEVFAEVLGPRRRALPADRIPERMAEAFVAVEDRRFWEHEGIDARGVVRAVVENLRTGDISEGASTIPMQLVRTLWAETLRETGPWRRKVIEARTAPQLIDKLGHEQVLALYLNGIYLGNGIYGVERASQHYFGVGANDLTVGQMATLVGITRSPEYFEPRRHPERAKGVRDLVLGMLAADGVIDVAEAEEARGRDLDVVPLDSAMITQRRNHLTEAVVRELRRVAPDIADRPGLGLRTTIHPRIQAEGEAALEAQLAAIEEGRYGTPVEPADSTARLEGAAVALDPTTSAVLAWVGGRSFSQSQFDRVQQSRRQVGSLIKPFLVALALESGYGIVDMASTDTVSIATNQGAWLPADHVTGTSMPLREALVHSSNRAAAHLGMTLGLDNVVQVGTAAGLAGPIPAVPSTSIGAFGASLLEITSAYSVFGNGGVRSEPYLLERVEASDGTLLWERPPEPEYTRVTGDATAFVVLDAMRAVVDRGTGRSIRSFGYGGPAAGKTGTTNEGRDAWFVGLTPEMVAGIWVGFDAPRPIVEDRGGGALAAPAWATWMNSLRGEIPQNRAWIPPLSVERIRYDPLTGEVIGTHCRGGTGDAYYYDAWVHAGRYNRSCPRTGVRGWLDRVWGSLTSDEPPRPPVRTIPRRPREGPGNGPNPGDPTGNGARY